MFSMKSS